MQKILLLAAAYYLQYCCFWAKLSMQTDMLVSGSGIRGYLSTASPKSLVLYLCEKEEFKVKG